MNTTEFRKSEVGRINSEVQSGDKEQERARLEGIYGKGNVWDTDQVSSEFSFEGFAAPYAAVRRKSDGAKGSLEFQHAPRFYFNFLAS